MTMMNPSEASTSRVDEELCAAGGRSLSAAEGGAGAAGGTGGLT